MILPVFEHIRQLGQSNSHKDTPVQSPRVFQSIHLQHLGAGHTCNLVVRE